LNPRRKKPARSSADRAGFFVICSGLFAGKPAPTGFVFDRNFVIDEEHCGSGLAREEAVTSTRDIGSETKKALEQSLVRGLFVSRET
jgi:hypothetical protein